MVNLFLSKILTFLGEDVVTNVDMSKKIGYNETWWHNTLEPIADLVGEIMVPLLILIASAGSIYSIVLLVQYVQADSSEKRDDSRKRLVNAIIGFVVLLVLLILLTLFCKYVADIGRWVTDIINKNARS